MLIKNKHIKCVSSCVTEGLDRNTSYFKRQAGKHATLCQPKTETELAYKVSKRESIKLLRQNPQKSLSNLFGEKMFTNTQNLNNEGDPKI